MPDIVPPTDFSNTGFLTWVFGGLCAIILGLWKRSEGQSVAMAESISKRLTQAELDLKISQTKTKECEDSRHEIIKDLAVTRALADVNSDRLNELERQFVRKAD